MTRILIAGLVVAVPFLITATASAKPRGPKPATLTMVEAPLGLQGAAGSGARVAIPFRLRDQSYRLTDVQIHYGYDRNGDGVIADDEFRSATENRFDPRDTRRNRAPQLFTTAADMGAAHAIVWRTDVDLGTARLVPGPEYRIDEHGRFVHDPFDPDARLVAYVNPGVQVRLRTVTGAGVKGPWMKSAPFSVSGNHAPSMRIDAVAAGAPVLVDWKAFDADTEDKNGNGLLDLRLDEDLNGNGKLDTGRVGVAFDWHRLAAGEDPATMSDAQLAALSWLPCTRDEAVGDTDALVVTPGAPATGGVAPGPVALGRAYRFAWDLVHDAGPSPSAFVLRATPFDEKGEHGSTTYSRIVVRQGD